jgi:O-antigen/teichoic acid export membrane protein
MATLALGSGIGRIIGIASIPVLTRLYSPEDFGVLAVFTALVAILAPLVTLRYALALPLPRHDGVAMNMLALSTGLMLGLTGLIALAISLWGAPLLALVSMQVLTPWSWLIALGVLGSAVYELLTMWATRRRAYKVIAQTNVTQSAAGALVKIGLGLAALQPLGLIVGQVVAQTGGVGRLISGFWAEMRANWRHVRASRIRKAAWRYRGFPVWRVPSQFLMVFSIQAPMLVSAIFFTPSEVGQLSVALMLVLLPANLISQSVGKAHYAEAALSGSDYNKLDIMTKSVFKRMLLISVIPSFAIFMLAPTVVPIALGSDWALSGLLAAILTLSLLAQMSSQSIINTLTVLNRHDIFLMFNVSRFVLTSLSLILPPILEFSIIYTVAIYSFTIASQRFFQTYVIFRLLRRQTKTMESS